MAEHTDEVAARIACAHSVIRGNGAYNYEQNMTFLATDHPELLEAIKVQCEGKEDRSFWRGELCNPLPEDPPRRPDESREQRITTLTAFTVLLHDSRRFLRTHQGNPAWASNKLMQDAVRRCKNGKLENTPELWKASLLLGIVRAEENSDNWFGSDNELLRYMSLHLDEIMARMDWLTEHELTIPFLEADFQGLTHSTLTSGWL